MGSCFARADNTTRSAWSIESLGRRSPAWRRPQAIAILRLQDGRLYLDPEISLAAAEYQLARVARVRGLPREAVRKLIDAHAQGRKLGFLGEPRVNVLELNLALDSASLKE